MCRYCCQSRPASAKKNRTCLDQRIDLVKRRHELFRHRIIEVHNRNGDVNFSKMIAVSLPKYRLCWFGIGHAVGLFAE